MNVQKFRQQSLKGLTDEVGVYALCDLDNVPIYVGQSVDGILARVRRHLTSARSDVIANRQIDVWEIAFVWAWPVKSKSQIGSLEAFLFHKFDVDKPLMNGSIPADPGYIDFEIPEKQQVQVLMTEEIETRRDPNYRLPRQMEHFGRLLDHLLNVKDSAQIRRSLKAHFERLQMYYQHFTNRQI